MMLTCKLSDGAPTPPAPPAPLAMDHAEPAGIELDGVVPEATPRDDKLAAIGLKAYLDQAGLGDDEQVLEKAYAWVQAQKPTSVGDIVQFNMVDDFVNALDLPIIPKTKLLGALKPQTALTPGVPMATALA